jgi:hypothetical protein
MGTQWPGLKRVIKYQTFRTEKGKTTNNVLYGITNSTSKELDVRNIFQHFRDHWSVENKCHWKLDTIFKEDDSTIKKDRAPFNKAILNRIVFNLLQKGNFTSIRNAMLYYCSNQDLFLDGSILPYQMLKTGE